MMLGWGPNSSIVIENLINAFGLTVRETYIREYIDIDSGKFSGLFQWSIHVHFV